MMLAFGWSWPGQPIYVFPLPAPVPAKRLVTFAVAISLALALAPAGGGVAHLAHLGGVATGFLYLKTEIGRASCRGRGEISVVAGSLKKKKYRLGVWRL